MWVGKKHDVMSGNIYVCKDRLTPGYQKLFYMKKPADPCCNPRCRSRGPDFVWSLTSCPFDLFFSFSSFLHILLLALTSGARPPQRGTQQLRMSPTDLEALGRACSLGGSPASRGDLRGFDWNNGRADV